MFGERRGLLSRITSIFIFLIRVWSSRSLFLIPYEFQNRIFRSEILSRRESRMRKDVIVCSRIVFGFSFKVIAVRRLVMKFRI